MILLKPGDKSKKAQTLGMAKILEATRVKANLRAEVGPGVIVRKNFINNFLPNVKFFGNTQFKFL